MRLKGVLCFFLALMITAGVAVRFMNLRGVVVWYDESLALLNLSGWGYRAALKEIKVMSTVAPVDWKALHAKYQEPAASLAEATNAHRLDQPEHAPGFYDSLFVWVKLLGNSRIATMRSWSALLGVLTIPAFAWFAFELFRSRQVSLIASALIALSPFLYCYSQELREYSMFAFVFSLSCAAFLRAVRTGHMRDWVLFSLISAFSLYCSLLTLMVMIAQAVFSLLTVSLDAETREQRWKAFIMCVGAIAGAVAVNFAPLIALFNHLARTARNTDWMNQAVPFQLLLKSWLFAPLSNWFYLPDFTFSFEVSRYQPYEPILSLLLVLELACCYLLMRRAPRSFMFLMCIFCVFAGAVWGQDLVRGGLRSTIPRYIFPVPMIAVFPIAFAIDQLLQSQKRLEQAGGVALLVLFACCQIHTLGTVVACRERGLFWYQNLPVAKILNERPRTLVIVNGEDPLLPQVLALGHLIGNERKIAWIGWPLPGWIYKVKSACSIHSDEAAAQKFRDAGFFVTPVDKKSMVSWLTNSRFVKRRSKAKDAQSDCVP